MGFSFFCFFLGRVEFCFCKVVGREDLGCGKVVGIVVIYFLYNLLRRRGIMGIFRGKMDSLVRRRGGCFGFEF